MVCRYVCRSVCRSVCLSVCLSVTLVSPAKTAVLIEMPFGLRTRVDPGNHVLDGDSDPSMGRGNFEERKGSRNVKDKEFVVTSGSMRPFVKLL